MFLLLAAAGGSCSHYWIALWRRLLSQSFTMNFVGLAAILTTFFSAQNKETMEVKCAFVCV